jgi:ATP-binding cassette, subfamily A (ABC1), member 3
MMLFPFFFMCIFLLPLFYMVTKLAEEKESKAREGMKMMGLNDKSYFASWFIFMLILTGCINGIITGLCQFVLFKISDLSIIFLIGFLYSMTLYGFSFILVAFLPSKKLSANFASMLHFLLFFLGMAFRGNEVSIEMKMIVSLIPNCALVFSLENAYHRELVGSGVQWSSITESYNNFTVATGLMMLALDIVLYSLLGYYCDQVAPREYGVPKPLNFPCLSKKTR